MTTGMRIKAARKKAGLTQAELAARLGISYQGVAQWENDLRNPKYKTLQKIADALEIPVLELLPEAYGRAYVEVEDIADAIKQDMMDHAPTWEEYKEASKIKLSDLQMELVLEQMEQRRLNRLEIAFLQLNATGQKKAIEQVSDLAKIPAYQKEE